MGKLTDKLLQQYADGELSPNKAETVERLLEEQTEYQAYVKDISELGNLVRMMNQESLSKACFDGFSEQVANKIRQSEQRGMAWDRFKVAILEFFEYRRVVWIPSAAVMGALLVAVLLAPLLGGGQRGGSSELASRDNIRLLSATPEEVRLQHSSKIESVDFGDAKGASYAIDDERGGTVGVVWIVETP